MTEVGLVGNHPFELRLPITHVSLWNVLMNICESDHKNVIEVYSLINSMKIHSVFYSKRSQIIDIDTLK